MNKLLIKENFDSANLFEKIGKLNENQIADIATGLDWTTTNISNAVLIGGTALIHYLSNSRDLTPDIDFMIGNINEVKSKLDGDNIEYREIMDGNIGVLGVTADQFNTDYLDSNVGNIVINKMILKTYKSANIGGEQVKIINPELLAIMKIELGRDKDTEDGFNLITSGILNKEYYLKLLEAMKHNLQDYKSLLRYADMI
jgi:predicted nucleotidyltransferase